MIEKINLGYKMQLLETTIRDKETPTEKLRESLYKLGQIMGAEILGQCTLSPKNIITPLLSPFSGFQQQKDTGISIIISTKDDYQYFATGIAEGFQSTYQGYLDFGDVRGENIFSSPLRALELPEILSEQPIKRVIIAKSVIASGCTAISLARTTLSKYFPEELIIVAPFYSQKGIDELQTELKNAKIYVAFGPDNLNENGLLVPGIGNIDKRIAG